MNPENSIKNISDIEPSRQFETIKKMADKEGERIAVKTAKPAVCLSYSQLVSDAEFLSRSIPFENHPIEIDLVPGINVIVALVAALKKNCKPVDNDRVSKVKLIINDNLIQFSGKISPRYNILRQYLTKSLERNRNTMPELVFDSRRQLRHQDFLDKMVAVLMAGGTILINNKLSTEMN